MARTARFSVDEDTEANAHSRSSRSNVLEAATGTTSPSPSISSSSDKENRFTPSARAKGKGVSQSAPTRPRPMAPRKRKLSERGAISAATSTQQEDNSLGVAFYDPEQDIKQRQRLRKDYRDLSRELNESRSEYLVPGSDGLIKTLNRSNQLYNSVKQTSDATLDSRLLVSTAELSMKRTTQLNLGDSSTGVDLDDFVSKCITFMRKAPVDESQPIQSQRRQNGRLDSDEEDEESARFDDGDAFNWEWLGRRACCPFSVRPPVPGFLLGPLSVQKRVRKATQRRENLQRRDPKDAVRPEEVKAQDLNQADNSNLTTMCTNIRSLLVKTCTEGTERVERDVTEDMSEHEIRSLMKQHGISDDGGVALFDFVVNPKSFGQTIENLFYVSFLIRDGQAGLGNDSNMLPTLHPSQPSTAQEIQQNDIQKRQAVFHLDFDTWEDIIAEFQITKSVIPARQADSGVPVGANGWYT